MLPERHHHYQQDSYTTATDTMTRLLKSNRSPEALHPYLKKRKRDFSWPHYDFNEYGEALVMPWEKFCRFEGCPCSGKFRKYGQLWMHLKNNHDLDVSGSAVFR
ncbi:hypothetical protein E0Z10_g5769 [Xylaria hypoxylon]|uniref:Uncharacterized protein n=1 Tax=Xylaria hypoxylon TaxID=37992 RepID=A0A4Z0YSJ3_9PEZI|nr:hypothetical protein E0Z10_g5769 [Xylaria hypoxylon]